MIISKSRLSEIRTNNRSRTIVLASGSFDVVHAGHVDYLTFARAMGDVLVVIIPNDKVVKLVKGPTRPINSEADRLKVIDALRAVDYVVLSDKYSEGVREIATLLEPDVIVVNKVWRTEDIEALKSLFPKAKVEIDNQEKINSSTRIMRKMTPK